MIDPKAIVTYSQYNEDLILKALLSDVKKGFYVDIGASYPTVDSVTKIFYDAGWNGINVEPIKSVYNLLKKERPRDININCGVGSKAGTAKFREYPKISGHSTFNPSQKKAHDSSVKYKDYAVKIKTLKDILAENNVTRIHFLKVDVEGFEYEVIKSSDWAKYRPEVICIEYNHIGRDWRPIITKNHYKPFIVDGINEYFIAEESWDRTEGFDERIVLLDYHTLKQHQYQSWSKDSQIITELTRTAENQQKQIDSLVSQINEIRPLSLKDKRLKERIQISIYGSTKDWRKFKREQSKK